MKNMCVYCAQKECPLNTRGALNSDCVFNLVIYENSKKILFYNLTEKKIFKIVTGEGLQEINFKDVIREIDIIPEKKPEWKRLQILTLAKDLGIFG